MAIIIKKSLLLKMGGRQQEVQYRKEKDSQVQCGDMPSQSTWMTYGSQKQLGKDDKIKEEIYLYANLLQEFPI